MLNSQTLQPDPASAYAYLLEVLSQSSDKAFIEQLLTALLTEKEQGEIANRMLIFALLQQDLPQREIAERLGVGIATVSRGAKAYQANAVHQLLPNIEENFLIS